MNLILDLLGGRNCLQTYTHTDRVYAREENRRAEHGASSIQLYDDRSIGTALYRLEYDFVSCVGRLYMPDDCCCDMSACLDLFMRIDKEVRCIETFAGDIKDTVYFKRGENWTAK